MLNFVLMAFIFLAVMVLIAFIGVLGLWMNGVGSIIFPGLNVIVGTQVVLIVLLIAEVLLVMISAYLVRFLPFVQELTEFL